MAELPPTCLAMAMISGVFRQYAGADGDSKTLSREEVRELLFRELPFIAENASAEEIIKTVDVDGDGKLNFKEYVALIGALCVCCDDAFKNMEQKQCKK